jgi:hypothetical protein
VVHRLVVNTVSGGQKEWIDGKWYITPYPVLVPSNTPKHIPDTRRARAAADPAQFFDVFTSHGEVTFADGTTKVIEKKTKMKPINGYIEIEKLMDRELVSFESFFVDVLSELKLLKFKEAPIKAS